MNPIINDEFQEALENEIADLELRLRKAKARLSESEAANTSNPPIIIPTPIPSAQSAHHYLLLLSDSALPLGSFAFSSGLESYLAHTRHKPRSAFPPSSSSSSSSPSPFSSFLPLSISSYASTTLPFALAAHRDPAPHTVASLDDQLDAAIVCAVGRRASVQQGRALLAIWEKSIAATADPGGTLAPFAEMLRGATSHASKPTSTAEGEQAPPPVSAHLAPLFGAVAALCGLSLRQAAYVFMLGHVKALVSAAVRAGLFGPYQAQRILAGAGVQGLLAEAIAREWDARVEEAGQSVPAVDLWVGRHELLYSRIFNS